MGSANPSCTSNLIHALGELVDLCCPYSKPFLLTNGATFRRKLHQRPRIIGFLLIALNFTHPTTHPSIVSKRQNNIRRLVVIALANEAPIAPRT